MKPEPLAKKTKSGQLGRRNEMVHLKFWDKRHPLHVDHEGSKRARAFNRRVNQDVRGNKYD